MAAGRWSRALAMCEGTRRPRSVCVVENGARGSGEPPARTAAARAMRSPFASSGEVHATTSRRGTRARARARTTRRTCYSSCFPLGDQSGHPSSLLCRFIRHSSHPFTLRTKDCGRQLGDLRNLVENLPARASAVRVMADAVITSGYNHRLNITVTSTWPRLHRSPCSANLWQSPDER